MITQRRIAVGMLVSAVLLSTSSLFSQTSSSQTSSGQQSQGVSDQDIDLLCKDIRSQKKQVIAANMKLTDAEAEKFWPIYDQYTAELVQINNAKYGAIKQYAQGFSNTQRRPGTGFDEASPSSGSICRTTQ